MANKNGVTSKKRQRKMDHLRECKERGYSKAQLRQKALHHMKMDSRDAQEAIDGLLYG